MRHEIQTHVNDYWNVAPRFGATWSPFKSGSTTIRGGVGIFYDWYEAQLYEQTLRVDGTRQVDTVVQNPGFPDPFAGGDAVVLPSSRYIQDDDLRLPTTLRTNVGVERTFGRWARVNAGYSFARGSSLFRGRNINAPLEDGSRPDPTTGNITHLAGLHMTWAALLGTGAAVIVIVSATSIVSARRVLTLEPAVVFRGG